MPIGDDIAATVLRDLPGILGVSVAVIGLFGAGEALRRLRGVPTEYTRKLAHLGSGVVVMGFPWMFASHWTVLGMAFAFLGILVGGRVTGLLASVHDVERSTGGAYFYPFAVYGTFVLSKGDPLLFCAPMAVMAVADTGAAIVGKRMGTTRYRVMDGARSLEGSFTFFAIAFAILLAGLAIDGRGGWPGVLLVAVIGAVVTTGIEAISVRGTDNLFIPYGGFLVLDRMLKLGLAQMGSWVEGMILGLTAVVLAWNRGRLRPAGAIAAFLFSTFAWALGGPAWFGPLAALAALLVWARGPDEDWDLEQVFPTMVGSALVVLAAAHSGSEAFYVPFLVTLSANGAIAMALIARAWGRRWGVAPAALAGSVVPALVAWGADRSVPVPFVALGGMAGLLFWFALNRTPFPGRRLTAAILTGLGAWSIGP